MTPALGWAQARILDDEELSGALAEMPPGTSFPVQPDGIRAMSTSFSRDDEGVLAEIPYQRRRRGLLELGWSVESNPLGSRYFRRRFAPATETEWSALVGELRAAYRTVYGDRLAFVGWERGLPVVPMEKPNVDGFREALLRRDRGAWAELVTGGAMVILFGLGGLIGVALLFGLLILVEGFVGEVVRRLIRPGGF